MKTSVPSWMSVEGGAEPSLFFMRESEVGDIHRRGDEDPEGGRCGTRVHDSAHWTGASDFASPGLIMGVISVKKIRPTEAYLRSQTSGC